MGGDGAHHADGGLAVQRLLIQGALPGDHEPRPVEPRAEPGQLKQQLDARPHPRAEEQQRGEPETAGRPGARRVPDGRPGDGRLRDVGPAGEPRLKDRDVLRRRALLRPVDRRRAGRPEQGVVHVGRELELDIGQVSQAGQVKRGQAAEGRPAWRQLYPGGVGQPRPEGLKQPRAAIGGGAAADAEHDPPRAKADGRTDQVAHAPGRRGARRELATGQQHQPARLRRLDHGDAVAQGEGRCHRLPGRPGRRRADPLEASGHGGVDRAVTAVRHGHAHDLAVEARLSQARRQPCGHFRRGQAALELVRREQHLPNRQGV